MEIPEGYKIVLINKEAQKLAQKKYYEANRSKINAQRRLRAKIRYVEDADFREKTKKRTRDNNRKKKKENENKNL